MENIDPAKLERAKSIYAKMLSALRAHDFPFEAHEENLLIVSEYRGRDLPIQFLFRVDPVRECITFYTNKFAFFADDKLVDAAYATVVANHGLVFGHFDLDLSDGSITYTMSDSYLDSELGEGFFLFMLSVAIPITDKYNDKFFMLSKDMIDLKKFIELC